MSKQYEVKLPNIFDWKKVVLDEKEKGLPPYKIAERVCSSYIKDMLEKNDETLVLIQEVNKPETLEILEVSCYTEVHISSKEITKAEYIDNLTNGYYKYMSKETDQKELDLMEKIKNDNK